MRRLCDVFNKQTKTNQGLIIAGGVVVLGTASYYLFFSDSQPEYKPQPDPPRTKSIAARFQDFKQGRMPSFIKLKQALSHEAADLTQVSINTLKSIQEIAFEVAEPEFRYCEEETRKERRKSHGLNQGEYEKSIANSIEGFKKLYDQSLVLVLKELGLERGYYDLVIQGLKDEHPEIHQTAARVYQRGIQVLRSINQTTEFHSILAKNAYEELQKAVEIISYTPSQRYLIYARELIEAFVFDSVFFRLNLEREDIAKLASFYRSEPEVEKIITQTESALEERIIKATTL